MPAAWWSRWPAGPGACRRPENHGLHCLGNRPMLVDDHFGEAQTGFRGQHCIGAGHVFQGAQRFLDSSAAHRRVFVLPEISRASPYNVNQPP